MPLCKTTHRITQFLCDLLHVLVFPVKQKSLQSNDCKLLRSFYTIFCEHNRIILEHFYNRFNAV
jgi:hypothetical protein